LELALSHSNMDFDSLSAQYALTKLYPSCLMVLGKQLTGSVKSFVTLNRNLLPIAQIKYVDLDKVTRFFMVDCQQLDRLDESVRSIVAPMVSRGKPGQSYLSRAITVFDHHALDPNGVFSIATSDSILEPVGAATTLLVERIIQQKIKLTAFDATVLAIGIYEDTGCLTYQGTTSRDADCIAYLLHQGADLSVIQEFIKPRLEPEQLELFEILLGKSMTLEVEGQRYVIACHELPNFVDGLATITRQLLDLEGCQGAFTIVGMRNRVHIVGRCDARAISARDLIRHFGGDGHPGAASAVVKNGDVDAIRLQVVELIRTGTVPQPVARDIMVSPVRTVKPDITMEEAGRIMLRYDLDGLIVAQDGEPVGVVSRRDIDQSAHHKLGHARVSGFMSQPVIAVTEDTPLSQMQQIMVAEDIGRLPVVDDSGTMVGLISRRDVLSSLFGAQYSDSAKNVIADDSEGFSLVKKASSDSAPVKNAATKKGQARRLGGLNARWQKLPKETLKLSSMVGDVAAQSGKTAYAVGGFVRDLLLGVPNYDLDYVIEGSAIDLASRLCERYAAFTIVATHERFGTATLRYQDNDYARDVDLSTARTEFYQFPAALPDVEPSGLEQDLLRRDFTINAMALCINPERFLELVDHFDGLKDLEHRVIRILHPFSFIEDPTRIIRAAKFAGRLNFHLEPKTREQARRALSMGIFDNLGGVRIKEELKDILQSKHRLKSLNLLGELGGNLCYLDKNLLWHDGLRRAMRRAERLVERYPVDDEWIVYLGALLSELNPDEVSSVLLRLHLTNRQKDSIESGLDLHRHMPLEFASLKRSDLYGLFHGRPREALAIAASIAQVGSYLRRALKLYLQELAEVKLEITGKDLLERGFAPGPALGQVLEQVLCARLDKQVSDFDSELKLATKLLAAGQ